MVREAEQRSLASILSPVDFCPQLLCGHGIVLIIATEPLSDLR